MPVASPVSVTSRQPPDAASMRRPAGPRVHETHVGAPAAASVEKIAATALRALAKGRAVGKTGLPCGGSGEMERRRGG